MKTCVSVGETAETLALSVPYSAFERSCAHDAEATDIGETAASYQRHDKKHKLPLISGTISYVKPGADQPLWTLIILLPKGSGWSCAVVPVDCFSSRDLGGFFLGPLLNGVKEISLCIVLKLENLHESL